MERRYTPDTRISELPGVGKVRAEKLSSLNIHTLRNLVYYFPRSYEIAVLRREFNGIRNDVDDYPAKLLCLAVYHDARTRIK